jgi:outer membrane receptor protein involved in Fe transport
MYSNPRLSYAIAMILSAAAAASAGIAQAAPASDPDTSSEGIQEITVSRAENMQDSLPATGHVQSYDQPEFTTYDASMGIAKSAWTAQIYGQNITDARAVTFVNGNQFVVADFVQRPRTVGARFSFKF